MSYDHLDEYLRRAIDFHTAVAAACAAKGGGAGQAAVLAALAEVRDHPHSEGARATLDFLRMMQRSSLAQPPPASERRCTPEEVAKVLIRADRLQRSTEQLPSQGKLPGSPRKDDPMTSSDDWMFDPATRAARYGLATAFAQHPLVATAEVTCNQAPLQVEGEFTDGSRYLFHCRNGIAELGRSVNHAEPVTHRARCVEDIRVEDVKAAVVLLHALIEAHGLDAQPGKDASAGDGE